MDKDPDTPPGLGAPGRSAVWEFSAPGEAGGYAERSLRDWGLGELTSPVSSTVTALATWNERNEPTGKLRLGLSLQEPSRPVLYVQITDQGILLPDPYRSQDDAKLAVKVLGRPCVVWGAGLESEGLVRTLWAIFSTKREEVAQ
ncbi:MAG TPA: hypothetical protein VGZ32_13295 [Actinocrinis sp.]|jgi:hypothetical protein|uniref:hypothetical protein n=1 Tax=Actinocrinis sp. TaxID=1920516 RepID=UPI002DDD20FB|nr:hypothetical protein [Actinocrinis sp.]HEV3171319.1 hypothetical protein [Actinocrinis sp.]